MKFKTIGEKNNPCVLLIHAMFATGESFNEIAGYLEDSFYIIIPTLDGHEEDEQSTFYSVKEEADKILKYLKKERINELDCMLGISLGGLIALEIFQRNQIKIKKAVIDGAPLTPCSKFLQSFMIKYMLRLIKSTKANPDNNNMSEESIKNILRACYSYRLPDRLETNGKKFVFVYGSEDKAKKCIPKIKTVCDCDINIKEGYAHCQYLTDAPKEYVKLLL